MPLKTLTVLAVVVVGISGCFSQAERPSGSIYAQAVSQLFPHGLPLGAQYGIVYEHSGSSVPPSYQDLLRAARACASVLEAARTDRVARVRPTIALATLQVLECLRDDGWRIQTVEVVVVS